MSEFDPLIGASEEGDLNEIMRDLVSVFGTAQAEPLEVPPIVDSLVFDADRILEEFSLAVVREDEVDVGGEATRGGVSAQEATRGGREEEEVDSWDEDAHSQAGVAAGEDMVRLMPVRIGFNT